MTAGPQPDTWQGAAAAGDVRGVVLFGGDGVGGAVSNQTWTWDGAAWSRRGGTALPAPPPLPRGVPSLLPAPAAGSGTAVSCTAVVVASSQAGAAPSTAPATTSAAPHLDPAAGASNLPPGCP